MRSRSASAAPAGGPTAPAWQVRRGDSYWIITYAAMASGCEVLACCDDASAAEQLAALAYHETARIEAKFSRYRDDNIVHAINHSGGAAVPVDAETARLLHYAGRCYELTEGRFDVTSGVLRRAWKFDGGAAVPDRALIQSLRKRIGWHRVEFDGERIRLEPGMELDLGGSARSTPPTRSRMR